MIASSEKSPSGEEKTAKARKKDHCDVSEVSKQYDISTTTLRYYERIGLIPPVPRTGGGVRDYDEASLGWGGAH